MEISQETFFELRVVYHSIFFVLVIQSLFLKHSCVEGIDFSNFALIDSLNFDYIFLIVPLFMLNLNGVSPKSEREATVFTPLLKKLMPDPKLFNNGKDDGQA